MRFLNIIGFLVLSNILNITGLNFPNYRNFFRSTKKYPLSQQYYETYLKRLNSQNITIQTNEILNGLTPDDFSHIPPENIQRNGTKFRIILNKNMFNGFGDEFFFTPNTPYNEPEDKEPTGDPEEGDPSDSNDIWNNYNNKNKKKNNKKSKHFEIVEKSPYSFKDVGGYESIKTELGQCIDILKNYTKYAEYNVRIPKGLILEGPPGNGKTLLAKALAGEAGTAFITVSGSEFQEMYVGVGSSRIRELFELAKKNIPCIIFIDEIDALGRNRGKDGEMSSAERDNTLNELLVALDGFKTVPGVFVIGATNRADLLDKALLRPGRIDKRIYIGNPDETTRRSIINIYLNGKPREPTVEFDTILEMTAGFSGAQIENFLNEAMLLALRYNRTTFSTEDLDSVYNKILAGWQPSEHKFTSDIIDHIAIHELGHTIVGLICKNHAKVTKVVINLSSPTSPAYTIFETSNTNIYTREALFEHLMILLSGRIAEEAFYGVSVTTGAINDFEEALKLAEKMIVYYGLGEKLIYPVNSEKYKEIIDNEITNLIQNAYGYAEFIVHNSKDFILEGAELLKKEKSINAEELIDLLKKKYSYIFQLKMMN
jgi:cell division protease FtsH